MAERLKTWGGSSDPPRGGLENPPHVRQQAAAIQGGGVAAALQRRSALPLQELRIWRGQPDWTWTNAIANNLSS